MGKKLFNYRLLQIVIIDKNDKTIVIVFKSIVCIGCKQLYLTVVKWDQLEKF